MAKALLMTKLFVITATPLCNNRTNVLLIMYTHVTVNAKNLIKIALIYSQIIGLRVKGCYRNFQQFVLKKWLP